MVNLSQITFESTLADLAAHHLSVSVTTLGKAVAQAFHEDSDLPGVVVLEESQFVGMISRTTFRELVDHIHRKNLYFNSPIKLLLDVIRCPPLQLSEDCTITEAAKLALSRPKALIYEPIVVCFESSRYCLLDMQDLLAAQTKLLTHAHQIIEKQEFKKQQYDQIIQQEKQKIKKAKRQLKSRHFSIQRQVDEDYSRQKAQIAKQTENIVRLNQKFTRVGQNVYLEAGKAFRSIFINANAIHRRADHLFEMSQAITKNLDAIHSTSALMSEIVEKIRHLAVQAAVVSYQTDSSRDELSRVNFEIGRLVNQTMTAKDKMHTVASQLQFNLREMNHLTTDDTQTTQSMLLQVNQVEKVIEELEQLVHTSLLEQSRLNNNPNACYLIQTIERVLKTKQNAAEELSQVGKR
jgi:hypothetical protein